MSYVSIETALKAILAAVSGLSSTTVTLADTSILDSGSPEMAVLFPGSMPADQEDGENRHLIQWNVTVDLFEKIGANEVTAWTAFAALRDAVINAVIIRPMLGQSALEILSVTIFGPEEPKFVFATSGSGPHFITQRLTVEVVERRDLAGGDYA